MFDKPSLTRALDPQRRCTALVRWLSQALREGLLDPETLLEARARPEVALGWLDRRFTDLPARARPARKDLADFSRLLSTALEGIYAFSPEPGQRLHSPGAHCFCPFCSWLVDAPHLTPKKLSARDKRRADRLEVDVVRGLSRELGLALDDAACVRIAGAPELREAVATAAWTKALLRRLEGLSEGPAALALWRRFAWTSTGAPKKAFELTPDTVLDAEARLAARIQADGAPP